MCAVFEAMIMSYLTRITQQKVLAKMKTKYDALNKQSFKLPGNVRAVVQCSQQRNKVTLG